MVSNVHFIIYENIFSLKWIFFIYFLNIDVIILSP